MVTRRHSVNSTSWLGKLFSESPSFLLALIIYGYPVAAVIVTVMDLESTVATIPYRAIVGLFSAFIILSYLNKKGGLSIAIPFVLFSVLYLIRLTADYINVTDGERGFLILYFVSVVLLPAIAIAVAGLRNVNEKALAYWVILLAFILMFGILTGAGEAAGGSELEGSRLSISALNPIALGNAAGSGVIATAWLALNVETKRWQKALYSIPILVFMYVLILAASRGPLLSVMFAVAWLLMSRIRYLLWAGPLVIIGLAIYLPNTLMYERFFGSSAGISSADENIFLRLEYQLAAFEQFRDSPFFGNVATLIAYSPLTYPHNMFAEVLMAMGIIGLFCFLWLMVRCVVLFSAGETRNKFLLVKLLFIQYFVAAQFSGALWGSGQVWALIGLLTGYQVFTQRKSERSPASRKTGSFGRVPAPFARL